MPCFLFVLQFKSNCEINWKETVGGSLQMYSWECIFHKFKECLVVKFLLRPTFVNRLGLIGLTLLIMNINHGNVIYLCIAWLL